MELQRKLGKESSCGQRTHLEMSRKENKGKQDERAAGGRKSVGHFFSWVLDVLFDGDYRRTYAQSSSDGISRLDGFLCNGAAVNLVLYFHSKKRSYLFFGLLMLVIAIAFIVVLLRMALV